MRDSFATWSAGGVVDSDVGARTELLSIFLSHKDVIRWYEAEFEAGSSAFA